MTQAKLLVVGGGETEQEEFALTLPATIGRGRENEITLPHPLVSREHCQITEGESGLLVRDMGSLNGTYVGSCRIEGDHPLQAGDLLTIGIVTFRVIIPGSSSSELRLKSVPSEEMVAAGAGDTTQSGKEWSRKSGDVRSGETETLEEEVSMAPRKAK